MERLHCEVTGKTIYYSWYDATEGMRLLVRKSFDNHVRWEHGRPQRVYECEFCGGWHMTSQIKEAV